MSLIRLDKFLAQTLHKSRSEVKSELKNGTVLVNEAVETRPERKVDPGTDRISYLGVTPESQTASSTQRSGSRPDGTVDLFLREKPVWLMFHKPAGCVTAREDARHRTVMDFIDHPEKEKLFPVGRLDLDTEGLLFFTNDGDISHRMLSPRHHVEKTYYAEILGTLSETDMKAFAEGIDIGDDKKTLPATLQIVPLEQDVSLSKWRQTEEKADAPSSAGPRVGAVVTIYEGRFHQVKRMFAACGCEVIRLKRIGMAGLSLDESLLPGKWRELTEEEMEGLYTYVKADRRSDF